MAIYMAIRIIAVPLMVSETVILSRSIFLKAISKSSKVSIDMPTLPTSPKERGSSESSPHWVGKSKATFNPDCPFLIKK